LSQDSVVFGGKNHVGIPTPIWWIVVLFIDLVSTAATTTWRSLSGFVTMVSHQHQGLKKLSQLLINLVNASPLLEGAEENEEMIVSTNKTYSPALVDMFGTLNDLGTFLMETIEGIGVQRIQPLCFSLSKCMVNLIEGIETVNVGRDTSNEATKESYHLFCHMNLLNCMVPSLQTLLESSRISCRNRCQQLKLIRLS
jgi:hypothetical protein